MLIGGVALSGLASLLCYFAPTMGWFVAARVVQGATGGAGITVSRASVGDLFEERELARMYAILTMALVIGTALAPYAGGLITRYAGWQSAFLLLAGGAAVIAAACFAWLPETRARATPNAHSFAVLWRESRALLARPLFMGYVLQAALIYALFFVFVSLAPFVMVNVFGMASDRFGLYYLFLAGGFFVGNLLVSRSAGHHDVDRQIARGTPLADVRRFRGAGTGLAWLHASARCVHADDGVFLRPGAGAAESHRAWHPAFPELHRRGFEHFRFFATRAGGGRGPGHGLRAGARLAAGVVVLRHRRRGHQRVRVAAGGVAKYFPPT